jgi:hypothetical protein
MFVVVKGWMYVPVSLIRDKRVSLHVAGRRRVVVIDRLSSLCKIQICCRLHHNDFTVSSCVDFQRNRPSRSRSASLHQSPIKLTSLTSPPSSKPRHSPLLYQKDAYTTLVSPARPTHHTSTNIPFPSAAYTWSKRRAVVFPCMPSSHLTSSCASSWTATSCHPRH